MGPDRTKNQKLLEIIGSVPPFEVKVSATPTHSSLPQLWTLSPKHTGQL